MYHPDRFRSMNTALLAILNADKMFSSERSAEHMLARDQIIDFYQQLAPPGECEVESWAILIGVVAQAMLQIEVYEINLWSWIKDASNVVLQEHIEKDKDTLEHLTQQREVAAAKLRDIDTKILAKKEELNVSS